AGELFPLYHVLADVCELRGAKLLESAPDDALSLASLAVRREGGGMTLLLANLEARPKTVRLEPGMGPAVVVRLNETTAPGRSTERVAGLTELAVTPFETVRIDT